MNNGNFGNYCKDNRNITKFQRIVDEIEGITYIKNIITFLTTMFQNL